MIVSLNDYEPSSSMPKSSAVTVITSVSVGISGPRTVAVEPSETIMDPVNWADLWFAFGFAMLIVVAAIVAGLIF